MCHGTIVAIVMYVQAGKLETQVCMWPCQPQQLENTVGSTDEPQPPVEYLHINVNGLLSQLQASAWSSILFYSSSMLILYHWWVVRAHCWWFPHIWKATWRFFFSNAEQLETLKQRNKVQNHTSHHSKRGTAEFCCTNLSLTTSGS